MQLHPDLFGGQSKIVDPEVIRGPIQARKKEIGYVQHWDSKRQCRHCTYCVRLHQNDRTYYKCQLIGITNSSASDIRLYAHCRLFNRNDI